MFTHAYALCGSTTQGSAWGYGAGIGKSPEAEDTYQPWSRASYLKQTFLTPLNKQPFQTQPDPYAKKCVLTDPATPHANAMIVVLGDASVRQVLRELAGKYPRLVGPVLEADGRPTAAYILNLNGARFLSDLDEPLQSADELLLMSSLSGG